MSMTDESKANQLPPLWQHQKEAIEHAGNRHALFFDPGCGKTRTAIELLKKFKAHKVIILAPLNVCRNWENELETYYKDFDPDFTVEIVAGQSKARKIQTLTKFKAFKLVKYTRFLICNIESLRSKDYLKLLCESQADSIVVDESHNLKGYKSLQTKGAMLLDAALKPKAMFLLTGTPAPQGEIDLWSTLVFMRMTSDSFFVWRKKNFDDVNERRRGTSKYYPKYVVSHKGKYEIEKALKACSSSAQKSLVLDLPPLIRTSLYAELSKEQAKHYDTMKEYLFAIDADGNELNASNLLVRSLRLQQILAGFIGDAAIKDNSRLQVLKDAIEMTQGEQFLIWTIFKETYYQIAGVLKELGLAFGNLTGLESAEERFQNMEMFQAGGLRCLIAHPKAGGVGVNLTAASYSIHYTRSFSLTDDLQCEARNYRGGSERHERITRIDIVSPKTIDEEIVKALKAKKSVQDFILQLKGGKA